MKLRPTRTERVSLESLPARLQQLQAQAMPDKSTSALHVYFSRSMGYWIGVQRRGHLAELGFYASCPCGM